MVSILKGLFCSFMVLFNVFYNNPELLIADDQNEIVFDESVSKTIIDIASPLLEDVKEIRLLAQLVHAEAGDQDLTGRRYVVDVVLNRIDSERFPNTLEEVIFQNNQFSVIKDGAFERAYSEITEEDYTAVLLERNERLNYDIIFFGQKKCRYANHHFKYQDHWFGW